MRYLSKLANMFNHKHSGIANTAYIASVVMLSSLSFSTSVFAEQLAITGAKIHTMSNDGIIEQGTVLIDEGRIEQVLEGVSVPDGYTQIDAEGKVITPGFIGALTNLGLVEVGMSAGVNDSRVDAQEGVNDLSTVGAAYDVKYAINTDSTLIDITRLEGFTSAVTGIGSTGQLFDGQGAFITLSKWFDSVIKPNAYMHVDLGHGGANNVGEKEHNEVLAILWSMKNEIVGV
jgi:hypothetical protein